MLEVLMRSAYALPPRKSACWKHAFAIHTCGRAKSCADDVFVAFASQNARPVFFATQACGSANGRTDDVFEAFAFQNGNAAIPHSRLEASAFQDCTFQACGSANGRIDDVLRSVRNSDMRNSGMRTRKRPHWRRFRSVRIPEWKRLQFRIPDWKRPHSRHAHSRHAEVQTAAMATFSMCSQFRNCLLYTSPSPRDQRGSRMPSSA